MITSVESYILVLCIWRNLLTGVRRDGGLGSARDESWRVASVGGDVCVHGRKGSCRNGLW